MMDVLGFALWGFLGAVVYASPRAMISVSERASSQRKFTHIVLDLVLSLAVGTILAAGFTQFMANLLRQTSVADLRAFALVLGMVANPIAPWIIHLVGENMLRRLGAPISKVGGPKS